MAILNVTDDSFSGDGVLEVEAAVARADQAIKQGAHVLDIGAESTRPGATPLMAEHETARLLPVLKSVRAHFPEIPISIDTYKAEVFEQAHACGGTILNSVRGLTANLLEVALATDATVIITDPGLTRPAASTAPLQTDEDFVREVIARLETSANLACAGGVLPERIILDPGIGFGKSPDQNIALFAHLPLLAALGYATLLGASRKSTLGLLTGLPPEKRDFATAATTAMAAMAKIDIVRVHHVAAAVEVSAVVDAAIRGRRPASWVTG